MLNESNNFSRGHGIPKNILQLQASSLDTKLISTSSSWEEYEKNFIASIKPYAPTLNTGAFGDIDLLEHRQWIEKVCKKLDLKAYLPLWKMDRKEILDEFFNLGFRAIIVVVKDGLLDKSLLGAELTPNLLHVFKEKNIDSCGENGEYHTMVVDGPIFKHKIEFSTSDHYYKDGYWGVNWSSRII